MSQHFAEILQNRRGKNNRHRPSVTKRHLSRRKSRCALLHSIPDTVFRQACSEYRWPLVLLSARMFQSRRSQQPRADIDRPPIPGQALPASLPASFFSPGRSRRDKLGTRQTGMGATDAHRWLHLTGTQRPTRGCCLLRRSPKGCPTSITIEVWRFVLVWPAWQTDLRDALRSVTSKIAFCDMTGWSARYLRLSIWTVMAGSAV